MEVCTNPDVLKVIYFFLLILDIVKIIIPIALIVLGIIDFSKVVITNDEKSQKKSVNLFLKRILYAALVFIVPWIVKISTVTLGNLIGEKDTVNFTDCIENANSEKIKQLENKVEEVWSCYVCKTDDTVKAYTNKMPSPGILCKSWKETNLSKEECK